MPCVTTINCVSVYTAAVLMEALESDCLGAPESGEHICDDRSNHSADRRISQRTTSNNVARSSTSADRSEHFIIDVKHSQIVNG
jgi:hypothetical protein